jgi:hypothetical protein
MALKQYEYRAFLAHFSRDLGDEELLVVLGRSIHTVSEMVSYGPKVAKL